MEKILVAMSGGVDSSAAAGLLLRGGDEVLGATMRLRNGADGEIADARAAAVRLGIPFYEFDLREAFEREVIDPFTRVYQAGGTPNPCIFCNRALKFGAFLERALTLGCDAMATGHYARIERDGARYLLKTACDRHKDQTYVLYGLTQAQLARVRFPLGGTDKDAVRADAARMGLAVAGKADSQDICFVPDGDYLAFLLARGLKPQLGDFYSMDGKNLGPHRGIEAYTIGQRRGLSVALGKRAYVVGKTGTRVLLGDDEALYARRIRVREINYIPFDRPAGTLHLAAKLRYSQTAASCLLHPEEDGAVLEFDRPQRAATPGQAAVFYDGDVVVGGGTITRTE